MAGNIYYKDDIWMMGFFNVNFFGYGRNGPTCKIDGQYRAYLDIKKMKFCCYKMGGYGSLTHFPMIEKKWLELNEAELKCMNDLIYEQYNNTMEYSRENYHNLSGHIRFLFEGDMQEEIKDAIWYPFVNKRISPVIMMGDEVIDNEDGHIFTVVYYHDIRYINRNEKFQLTKQERHVYEEKEE